MKGELVSEMNTGAKKPRKTNKPWGYEALFAHTDKYAGKVIFVKKGHRLSLQYHQKKDETIHVYEGELILQIGEKEEAMTSVVLKSGEGMWIRRLVRHRMEAIRTLICLRFQLLSLTTQEGWRTITVGRIMLYAIKAKP